MIEVIKPNTVTLWPYLESLLTSALDVGYTIRVSLPKYD